MADVVQLLEASLDPKQHRQAENALIERDKQPGFSVLLLRITADNGNPLTIRLAAALCFKNLVKRSWCDEEGNHLLPAGDVETIKSELVNLMTASPLRIEAQLGDAIAQIARSDFPTRWPDLVASLVVLLSPTDHGANRAVLQVAHSIFRPYRHLMRSPELSEEIDHVYQVFGSPLLGLISDMDTKIDQMQSNKVELEKLFRTFDLAVSILYDLTAQDLSEEYEKQLPTIAQLLLKYLTYENSLLHTDDDSESGLLESVKASILDVLTLWCQQWREIVTRGPEEETTNNIVPQFVQYSWTLLTLLGPQPKYDLLANRALQSLTILVPIIFFSDSDQARAFNDEGNLSQIIENVILPNMALRESDIELFEDEPVEFIRRDLEGGDAETRRRGATDFLRQLIQHIQQHVTKIVMQYVDQYLQDYSTNRAGNWRSKDTAVYLFCAVAALGQATAAHGVKTLNPHVNVVEFFQKNMVEDLTSPTSHIILQVDAIKFLFTFRSIFSAQQWGDLFPPVIQHLGSQNYVLHTYSAVLVDRVLRLTDDRGEPFISRDSLTPVSRDILQRLFALIERNSAPEKVQENEFLMRCIMRVLVTLKEKIDQLSDLLVTHFLNILRVIRHNPSNPLFYFYFFESIGALVRYSGPSKCQELESKFYNTFVEILQENVQEFVPYVFQLFAAFLEANPSASLPKYYQDMIPLVLQPGPWEYKGNTPALVRLLCSLIQRGTSSIISNNQIEPTLGIFQKLISSKVYDVFGFDVLETILTSFPLPILEPYLSTIFSLLLRRLSDSKTDAFQSRFVRLYHFLSARTGVSENGIGSTTSNGSTNGAASSFSTDRTIAVLDSIQKDVFAQIYPPIILPETLKFQNPLDRKLAVISLTKTVGDSETFAQRFAKGWSRTVEALLALMVNPPVLSSAAAGNTAAQELDMDSASFGATFAALNTIRQPPKDHFSDIDELKTWIGEYLKGADERHGGRIGRFINERLSSETQQAFIAYMQR